MSKDKVKLESAQLDSWAREAREAQSAVGELYAAWTVIQRFRISRDLSPLPLTGSQLLIGPADATILVRDPNGRSA